MLQEKIGYQFIPMPLNLFNCLDIKCRSTLCSLIQLSSHYAKEENDWWFYRTYGDLQAQTKHSKRVLEATLDALYRHGIIDIICVEQGRGMKFVGNQYKVLFDSFEKYESLSIEDTYKNPKYEISTPNYNAMGYKVSFRNQVSSPQCSSDSSAQSLAQSSAQNDYNIDNRYNINNIEEIYNKLIINKESIINEGLNKFDYELYSNSTLDILDKYSKELYSSFKFFKSDEFCGKEKFFEIVQSEASTSTGVVEELFKFLIRAQAERESDECITTPHPNDIEANNDAVSASCGLLGLSEEEFYQHIMVGIDELISITQEDAHPEKNSALYVQAVEDCIVYFGWNRGRADRFVYEMFETFRNRNRAS